MNSTDLNLSYSLITNHPDHTPVTTDRFPISLTQVQQVTTLAANECSQTALYGITQLATEFQRQKRLLAKQEEDMPEQRSQLRCLTLDCIAKLQGVNVQLSEQLLKILSR